MSQREYRFITDPEHKENLSGRVRAACANCRRKKIKCSGTVPCRICEDKGRVCEGLLPTDGAKSGLSPASSSSSAKVTKAQRPNAPGKKPSIGTSRRPSLKPIGSDESADSGYISNAPQPQSTVQTVHSPVAGGLYSVSGQGEGADGSDAMSPASALSDMAQGAISSRGSMSVSNDVHYQGSNSDVPPDWHGDRSMSGASNLVASDLVAAAAHLETQARALRRLASQQQYNAEAMTRTENFSNDWMQATNAVDPSLPMDTNATSWQFPPNSQDRTWESTHRYYQPALTTYGTPHDFENTAYPPYPVLNTNAAATSLYASPSSPNDARNIGAPNRPFPTMPNASLFPAEQRGQQNQRPPDNTDS